MASRVNRLTSYTGALILLLVGSLMPVCVSAQQPIIPLQLSFSDPGARSMGFGGAFVALADDATATFANPAGLVQLLKPEFSIEGRYWSYSSPYTVGGRAEGLPSGVGIDDTVGLRTTTSEHSTTGLSFLSFAYPVGKWSLAIFRHENANLKFSSETQGLFFAGTDCCQDRFFDQRATSDLDFLSYGFSAAYRISDRFALGLGVVYHDVTIESNVEQYLWDDETLESFFGRNSYLPERLRVSQRSSVHDTDWTFTGGILWRLAEGFSIGAVYRQGMETYIEYEVAAGAAVDFGVPPGQVFLRASGGPIEFPDIYGLGFAYRAPDGRLTLSFQWDRVEYSDIPASLGLDDQTIDDADELHLGAEYVFLGSTPIIAVRLGTWLDPDHQMRATTDEPFIRALMPRGDSEVHYAAGIGVAMQQFQIDLAMDFADRADTLAFVRDLQLLGWRRQWRGLAKRLSSHSGVLALLLGRVAGAGCRPGSGGGRSPPVQLLRPGRAQYGLRRGAFVALADDATAAFSNPAGLTQLLRPEISIEGRRWGLFVTIHRARKSRKSS